MGDTLESTSKGTKAIFVGRGRGRGRGRVSSTSPLELLEPERRAKGYCHLEQNDVVISRKPKITRGEASPEVQEKFPPGIRKFFEVPKWSLRYGDSLTEASARLVDVVNGHGRIIVTFEDEKSVERFACLRRKMLSFYTSKEGHSLMIPTKSLQRGEIVAAVVHTETEDMLIRRVKVIDVLTGESRRGKAYAHDIDDLSHWYINVAFALHESFYNFPSQACVVQISNFEDVYPKDLFEVVLSRHRKYDFKRVMNELSYKVLLSQKGNSLHLSNLRAGPLASPGGQNQILGNLDPAANWRLHPMYLEEFHNYFIQSVPQKGEFAWGEITDVSQNGDISICRTNSLYSTLKEFLHELDANDLVAKSGEGRQEEIVRKIHAGESSLFLAIKNGATSRVKVKSYYGEEIRVIYIDAAKEILINPKDLICSLTNNNRLPSILAAIPPQAIRVHLAGVQFIENASLCERMTGLQVEFQVCETPLREGDLHEAEVHITSTLNDLIIAKSPLLHHDV